MSTSIYLLNPKPLYGSAYTELGLWQGHGFQGFKGFGLDVDQTSGFRVKVKGLEFRVKGVGFRVQGLGNTSRGVGRTRVYFCF